MLRGRACEGFREKDWELAQVAVSVRLLFAIANRIRIRVSGRIPLHGPQYIHPE